MRRLWSITALLWCVSALPVGAEAAEHGGGKAGLPQLDPHWFASQVFWLAVHFLVLYLVAARFILPGFTRTLAARDAKIADDLAQAKAMNTEAKQVKRAYEIALADARAKANAAREASVAEGATERRWAEDMQAEELAKRVAAAHERIASESQAVRLRMRDVAAEATTDLVRKLTGVAIAPSVVESVTARLLDNPHLREGA